MAHAPYQNGADAGAVPIDMTQDWAANYWDWPLKRDDGFIEVVNTDERFEVCLEMQSFTPKEIEVKVCSDQLVVHCRHEPRADELKVIREVNRAYKIPQDVDVTTIKSHLNSKSMLVITAKKRRAR